MVDQSESTAHIFAQIQAPRINSISSRVVQDFLADYEAYEDAIDVQTGLKAVLYRSCFPATYLRYLALAQVFGDVVTNFGQPVLGEVGGARSVGGTGNIQKLNQNGYSSLFVHTFVPHLEAGGRGG